MWFKYLHRQAGLCIYRRGTAQQLWPSMPRVSPQLWHPIPEELRRSWKTVSEGDSTKTAAWCCRCDQTFLMVVREGVLDMSAGVPHVDGWVVQTAIRRRGKISQVRWWLFSNQWLSRGQDHSPPQSTEQVTDQRNGCTQQITCVLIDFTVYFLLKAKFSPGSRKGALHQIQQWGWILGVEKTCNMTVAIKEAEVQSRIHIWNCYLPTSKHAEGGLNTCSGYGWTTSPCSESFLIFMARNLKSGTQRNSVCFLGRSCSLWTPSGASVAVLCSWADPCFSGGGINAQAGTELQSELNWDQEQTVCPNKEVPRQWALVLSTKHDQPGFLLKLKKKKKKIHFSFQLFLTRNVIGHSVLSVSLRPAVKSLNTKL